MTPLSTPLINEHEAARRLGIQPCTLRRWRWAGQGPRFHKIGRAVRYAESDLQSFVVQAARTSTSQVEA